MAISVSAAGNYLSNTKRLFEESPEAGSPFGAQQPAKRVRLLGSPPLFGRCNPAAADCFAPFQASSSAVAALFSLFPDMEEQAVIAVLSDCGDNIDAAIKRLSQLRLNNSSSRPAKEEQEQSAVDHGQHAQAAASTSGTSGEAQSGDWVELLVQEMAAAKDMADARVRAARLLAIFSKHLGEQGTNSGLLEKLQELNKENHILKRAVQIQNSKLQERSQQEQEIQQLRVMLGQYQEQVRTLELNNYSLVLHLQKATNGSAMAHGHHHPDVC